MTQAEQASLDALRGEVQAGFREIRDLMEVRRLEEVRVQEAIDARLIAFEVSETARIAVEAAKSAAFKATARMIAYTITTVVTVVGLILAYHFHG